MKRMPIVLLALAAVGCLVAACSAVEPGGGKPTPSADIVPVEASWAWSYGSIAELTAAADLVVSGTVGDVRIEQDTSVPDLPAALATITVSRVLKGPAAAAPVIKQTGGTWNGRTYEVPADPVLQSGDAVLLYLQRVTVGPYAGRYVTLGGPDGRFTVADDGSIRSLGGIPVPAGSTVAGLAGQ